MIVNLQIELVVQPLNVCRTLLVELRLSHYVELLRLETSCRVGVFQQLTQEFYFDNLVYRNGRGKDAQRRE